MARAKTAMDDAFLEVGKVLFAVIEEVAPEEPCRTDLTEMVIDLLSHLRAHATDQHRDREIRQAVTPRTVVQ